MLATTITAANNPIKPNQIFLLTVIAGLLFLCVVETQMQASVPVHRGPDARWAR